jgi:hypothetical protein
MTKQLILARYNEDIKWTESLPFDIELIIYNKGKGIGNNLPNIGREAHTYLHHLCNGKLADRMVFAQADPFYHCGPRFVNNMVNFLNGNDDFVSLSMDVLKIEPIRNGWHEFGILNYKFYSNHHQPTSAIIQVAKKHFPKSVANGWEFGPGACFGVSIEAINYAKKRERLLPELLEYTQSNPGNPIHGDESHVMERIWKLIFTS